jgi:hypothetical protein
LHADPKKRDLSVLVRLRVGPFEDEAGARAWKQEFVRATTLGWDSLASKRISSKIEARIVQGTTVREITGINYYQISIRPEDPQRRLRTVIHLEINEGEVETLGCSDLKEAFDIDPKAISPQDLAVDLEDHIREFVRAGLDE